MKDQNWLAERKKGIGGSDVGAIIGVDKYRNIADVWLDKTGKSGPIPDNYAMARGRTLEPLIRQQFCTETGLTVQHYDNKTVQHPHIDYLRASYDGMTSDGGILEIKTMNQWMAKAGTLPPSYHWQLQHYLFVSGASHGYFAIDAGGLFKYERVEIDPAYKAEVLPKLVDFWNNYVLTDTPPPMPKQARPEPVSNDMAEADYEALQMMASYKEISEQIKDLEAVKDQLKGSLIDAMKGASGLHMGGVVLATYKVVNTNRFDQTSFAKAHPDLAKEYTKQSSYTRLDIK